MDEVRRLAEAVEQGAGARAAASALTAVMAGAVGRCRGLRPAPSRLTTHVVAVARRGGGCRADASVASRRTSAPAARLTATTSWPAARRRRSTRGSPMKPVPPSSRTRIRRPAAAMASRTRLIPLGSGVRCGLPPRATVLGTSRRSIDLMPGARVRAEREGHAAVGDVLAPSRSPGRSWSAGRWR